MIKNIQQKNYSIYTFSEDSSEYLYLCYSKIEAFLKSVAYFEIEKHLSQILPEDIYIRYMNEYTKARYKDHQFLYNIVIKDLINMTIEECRYDIFYISSMDIILTIMNNNSLYYLFNDCLPEIKLHHEDISIKAIKEIFGSGMNKTILYEMKKIIDIYLIELEFMNSSDAYQIIKKYTQNNIDIAPLILYKKFCIKLCKNIKTIFENKYGNSEYNFAQLLNINNEVTTIWNNLKYKNNIQNS